MLTTLDHPTTSRVESAPVLYVSEARRTFTVDSGSPVTLMRRGAPWLILNALLKQRDRAPGSPLSSDALVGVGWPGEVIGTDAARARLYFAVCELRRAGLTRILLTAAGGYMIDPLVRIAWTDVQAP